MAATTERRVGGWPDRERVQMMTRLRPEQLAGLKRLSEARDLPVASLIRRGVDLVLQEAGEEHQK